MKVIVIGGGIGGLTAAIALQRRNIEVEVFERSPELREVGAGISLWPNAMKALRKLGLGAALDPLSHANSESFLRTSTGAILSRTPAGAWEQRFGSGMVVFHRADLLNALAQAVGPSALHLNHACEGFNSDPDGGVTARFTNGSTVRGDALIGADGLHSAVRAALGHRTPPRYSGYTAWRGIPTFPHAKLMPGETWGSGKRFGIVPVQGGRVYWYATANVPESGSATLPQSPLDLFRGWHEPVEALIRATPESAILRNPIYDRDPIPDWGKGRVTLLGDAAHPMTPNLGQGACQAIEDALELAATLAKPNPSVEQALRAYESRRMNRTKTIVLTSRRIGNLGQIESAPLCFLRNLALRLTPVSATLNTLAPIVGYEGHLADPAEESQG